jgi:hypothetical protein
MNVQPYSELIPACVARYWLRWTLSQYPMNGFGLAAIVAGSGGQQVRAQAGVGGQDRVHRRSANASMRSAARSAACRPRAVRVDGTRPDRQREAEPGQGPSARRARTGT